MSLIPAVGQLMSLIPTVLDQDCYYTCLLGLILTVLVKTAKIISVVTVLCDDLCSIFAAIHWQLEVYDIRGTSKKQSMTSAGTRQFDIFPPYDDLACSYTKCKCFINLLVKGEKKTLYAFLGGSKINKLIRESEEDWGSEIMHITANASYNTP
jgi:hypothetical protein